MKKKKKNAHIYKKKTVGIKAMKFSMENERKMYREAL